MGEGSDSALKLRLLLHLVRRPLWLVGIACDVTGFGVQVAALSIGELVVVQPLLVSTLIFALPIGSRISHQTVGPRELRGAVTVAIGLVLYVSLALPQPGMADTSARDWITAAFIVVGLAITLAIGGLRSDGAVRSALLGAGAGLLFGVASALTKMVVELPDLHPVAVLSDWRIYALAVFGIAGMLFAQSAFQAGALAPAVAAIVAFDPVAAGVVGVTLLGEQFHPTPLGALGTVAGALLMVLGIFDLSRSSAAVQAMHGP